MKIKEYWIKTKEFFKDLFGYKNRTYGRLDDKFVKYEKELINLYNNFMSSLERMYSGFSGERLQFQPITSLRRDYKDLFSEDTRNKFNIYETNKGLILRRKGLERRL